jgi:hypothetical protein
MKFYNPLVAKVLLIVSFSPSAFAAEADTPSAFAAEADTPLRLVQ